MRLISYPLGGNARLYADLHRQQGQARPRKARPCQPPDQVLAAFFQAPETNRPWPPLWQGLSSTTGGPARRSPNRRAIPGKPNEEDRRPYRRLAHVRWPAWWWLECSADAGRLTA